MKRTLILLVSLLVLLSCDQISEADDSEKPKGDIAETGEDIDSVKALIKSAFEDIWSDLDSKKIEAYHTDDFLLLEDGIVWNNDSVRSYLSREYKEMEAQQYRRLNRFEFLKSVHNERTIWVAYDNYGTWVKGTDTLGTAHWLESAIAVKEGSGWKLQQLHSTRVRK